MPLLLAIVTASFKETANASVVAWTKLIAFLDPRLFVNILLIPTCSITALTGAPDIIPVTWRCEVCEQHFTCAMLPNDFVRYGSINNRYFNNVPFSPHLFLFEWQKGLHLPYPNLHSYMGITVANYDKSRKPKPLYLLK